MRDQPSFCEQSTDLNQNITILVLPVQTNSSENMKDTN